MEDREMKNVNKRKAGVVSHTDGVTQLGLTIKLNPHEWQAVQAAAKREGVTVDSYVTQTLRFHSMELRNRHGCGEPPAVMKPPTRHR